MSHKRLLIYVDGAARGNPGPAGIGVVIKDLDNKRIKDYYSTIDQINMSWFEVLLFGFMAMWLLNLISWIMRLIGVHNNDVSYFTHLFFTFF